MKQRRAMWHVTRRVVRSLRHFPLFMVSFAAFMVAACTHEETGVYQGYVEGEYVRVATSFAGSLEQLDVQRGVRVARGDALFALENENEAAARREAEERLRNAEAQLANLQKSRRPTEIESVRAQLEQADAGLKLSRAQLKRTEELVAQHFLARERLDEARSAYEQSQARVEQLKADVATARLAARVDEIKAARAAVAAARATLEQADWRLKQKSATAPVAGLVADTLFVKGEWVPAGAPVVTLLPPENVKVRFFVPEPKLGAVREGESVLLNCDGCSPNIPARVTFIAPQAEYTPPVIYSRDSRAKLVFLIEARAAPQDSVKLHPGQPVDVRLAGGTGAAQKP